MREGRKKAVSLRVFAGDARRIKRLADRLGVSESDVIRFAIKMMLARLGPLCDPQLRGKQVVPVLLDAGSEMLSHFRFDAAELAEIINDGAPGDDDIDAADLQLLSRLGSQQDFVAPAPQNGGPQNGGPSNGGPSNGGPSNGGPRNGQPVIPPATSVEMKLRAKYGQAEAPAGPRPVSAVTSARKS